MTIGHRSYLLLAVFGAGSACWDRGGFDPWAVDRPPGSVSAIVPARGPDSGGVTVTLRGTGFTAGDSVTLGGTICSNVESISANELRCTSGPHAPGEVDVVVTSDATARLERGFVYLPTSFSFSELVVGAHDPHGDVDGSDSTARFGSAGDMEVVGDSLFVTDPWNQAIREIDLASGDVSTYIDDANWMTGIGTDGTSLFISSSQAIWRIDPGPSPALELLAGTPEEAGSADGPPNIGQLSGPAGITYLEGALYVADSGNGALRAISLPAGELTTLATGMGKPYDVSSIGNDLVVAAYNACSVYRVTTGGNVSLLAGGDGSAGTEDGTGATARFSNLTGVVALSASQVVVADSDNHTLRHVRSPVGEVTTWCGLAGEVGTTSGSCADARFYYPYRFAAAGGDLFVSDESGAIRRIDVAALQVSYLAGGRVAPACVDGPGAVARFGELIDGVVDDDSLYVTDRWCASIRRVSLSDGSVTTLVGGRGRARADGPAATAGFDGAHGIARLHGLLYVTEDKGVTLRRFDPVTGLLETVAGEPNHPGATDGTGAAARFNTPTGIDVVGEQLLVVETSPNRLRRVDPVTGEVTTVTTALSGGPRGVTVVGEAAFVFTGGAVDRVELAGGAVERFSGGGCCGFADGDATVASYSELWHGDTDGLTLVVADGYNNSVRRVSLADGSVTSWLVGPDTVQDEDGDASTVAIRQPRSVVLSPAGIFVLNAFGVRRLD